MKRFFDSNALWLSMVIGALGHRYLLPLAPILPWLIFFMLFFTFCKVNPLDLRLHKWHWVVLAAQLFLSLTTYLCPRAGHPHVFYHAHSHSGSYHRRQNGWFDTKPHDLYPSF